MAYLITGATGDVGARVVELLVRKGERPRVFVRDAHKARSRFGDRVDIVVGDLGSPDSLRAALEPRSLLAVLRCFGFGGCRQIGCCDVRCHRGSPPGSDCNVTSATVLNRQHPDVHPFFFRGHVF